MGTAIYEKKNRIAYVTLNRPAALNALDDELNEELWRIWSDFSNDPAMDVAILTGAGKAFCAGADLKTFIPRWEHANMLEVRRNAARGAGATCPSGGDTAADLHVRHHGLDRDREPLPLPASAAGPPSATPRAAAPPASARRADWS